MSPERLSAAIQVLHQVSRNFANMPEAREEASEGCLALVNAALYLTELAYHLEKGRDPYDALLASARAQVQIRVSRSQTV